MQVSSAAFQSLLFVAVALAARAQDPPAPPPPPKERLTLATVLARGAALAVPLPRVVWMPNGHTATLVVANGAGEEALHRFADGKVGDAIVDAKTLLTSIDAPPKGPARFPPLRWIDDTTLRVESGSRVFHWRVGAPAAAPAPDDKNPPPDGRTPVLQWPEVDTGDDADASPLLAVAPDDRHAAAVHTRQLWLHGRDGRSRQLTFDGSDDVRYGTAAHRAEFGIDRGLFWSTNGRFLCFSREDQRPIAEYPYQDERTAPPHAVHGRYPMAGSPHARVRLGVCDTEDYSVQWLEGDADADVYWTNVTFLDDGTLAVALVNRGQDHMDLVRFDCSTGRRVGTLLQEHDAEWVEPEHGPTFLPDGTFLWSSPRNGNHHLWRFGKDGAVLAQVTKGAFDVQRVRGLTPDGKHVWFEASGEDPRQLHLLVAAIDGSEVRQLTRERGTHRADIAPDGTFAAVVWSNLETPPTARLLDLASGAVTPLPQPADPLAKFALPTQRLFQIKAEDDTVLYGHVALPPDLADGQKCPVLLYVYGGPHEQLVTDQWLAGAPLWLQTFAAEGYAVCRLDNRGTPHRGIAFEQAVHRRLGVLEVNDQLGAVEWLKQQPWVDAERIAVHGWSFGGYMTLRLLLAAPTTFACGVSGAPVTDWRLYETGYTERYMDMPAENDAGYTVSSCLPFAERLARPLLLVHGTDDRTVVWAHSLQFVDRCVAAGKTLDYFPYPGQRHRLVGKARPHFLTTMHDWLGQRLGVAAVK